VPPSERDHIGVHEQKDGDFYVGFAPRVGRVDGPTLARIADAAEAAGSDQVRTTTDQKMLILDVAADKVEPLVDALAALDLQVRPSVFRRHTMACTGIEFCKLAIVETKALASATIDELEKRLPGFDTPITINVNGCPNSCARIQTADIGLKGQLVRDAEGNQVEGFQVHLGGHFGSDLDDAGSFGRKVRGLKVTAAELPDYVERVLRNLRGGAHRGRVLRGVDGPGFGSWQSWPEGFAANLRLRAEARAEG
jgi:sulfite reductase (ferredoxin)